MKTTPRRSSRRAFGAGGEQRRRDPGKARILVVQPELDDPPHLFGERLAEAGATLEVVHPYAGEAVPTLDGYAALLVLGGAPSANDDEILAWIGPVKELIREAVAEGGLTVHALPADHYSIVTDPVAAQVADLVGEWLGRERTP